MSDGHHYWWLRSIQWVIWWIETFHGAPLWIGFHTLMAAIRNEQHTSTQNASGRLPEHTSVCHHWQGFRDPEHNFQIGVKTKKGNLLSSPFLLDLLEECQCFTWQKWVQSSDYLSTCTKLNRNNIFNAINDLCPYIIRLYFSHKWTNSPIYLKLNISFTLFYSHKHIPSQCNFFFHSHYCNKTICKSNFNLIQNKRYLYKFDPHILRHHKIFPGDKIWTLPCKK